MWQELGIPQPIWDTLIRAWSPATTKQYTGAAKRWRQYTTSHNISATNPSVAQVLSYLQNLTTEGAGYGTVNTAKSFLSAFISLEGTQLGTHPLVARFMRGLYRKDAPKSKYTDTWDPRPILLTMSNWGTIGALSLEHLTKRTAMLFLLATGQRLQALAKLKREDIKWGPKSCRITYTERLKSNDPKKNPLVLRFCQKEDTRTCVYTHLFCYLRRPETNNAAPYTFATLREPHTQAAPDTISRWVRETLTEGGVSSLYTPYSTRHAATNAASRSQVPLP